MQTDLEKLKQLLALLKESGVVHYKDSEVELRLSETAVAYASIPKPGAAVNKVKAGDPDRADPLFDAVRR